MALVNEALMQQLATVWAVFQGLLLEAIPFLLIGVAISSIAMAWDPRGKWLQKLPQGALAGPLSGALLGFALPACECGNVPVARRMIAVGAPLGTALGFLFAPDYSRSLELLEPGLAPKQLWLGTEALLATACSGGGERVWLLLLSGIRKPQLELLELNKQGKTVQRVPLTDKELDPGSKLHYDATRQVLLLLLRQKSSNYQQPAPAKAHLINTNSYSIEVIPGSATQVGWLPPRKLKKI